MHPWHLQDYTMAEVDRMMDSVEATAPRKRPTVLGVD